MLTASLLQAPVIANDSLRGFVPLTAADFIPFDERRAKLGQLLFYDPILSGNQNISCGTCHHHTQASADGLALGIGEGGEGIGEDRTPGKQNHRIEQRVPRNSPALFNLGAREIKVMFHDGRLSIADTYGNGYNSPAQERLPENIPTLLAAQVLFPLTSETEMAGRPEENEVAGASNDRIDNAWPIIAERLRKTGDYPKLFIDAFDEIKRPADINIVHAATAIADFINSEWPSVDSEFDRYLKNKNILPAKAQHGLELFTGKAQCINCHNGALLTDHKFYNLALPQFGPGRTRQFDPQAQDVGHMAESDRLEDEFRFRTPSLRNVELTAPYGHNGAYSTLRGIIQHHLTPTQSLIDWQPSEVKLTEVPWLEETDFVALEDHQLTHRLLRRVDIEPVSLSNDEIEALVQFMKALTGLDTAGRLGPPPQVPSGLPVD